MARRTVIAPKAVTKSKQLVSPQQSTEAIQIMMTSTVCTIAFLRELLPERYFDKRIITTEGEQLSHTRFVDQNDAGDEDSQPAEGSVATMVFKRGASQRGDQILQLLESGVYHALKHGDLVTFQISILAAAEEPVHVLETYTITREQLDNAHTDFSAEHHSGKKLTISDVQAEIVDFVGQLSQFCAKLPFLPKQRYLRLELETASETDFDYRQAGFVRSDHGKYVWPQAQGWTRSTQTYRPFESGTERMSLQLCHMIHERATQNFIPDDIHFGSSPPEDTAPAHNQPDAHSVHDRTPSTVIEGDLAIHVAASAVQREDPSPIAEPPAEEESTWLGPVEGTQGSAQSVAAVQMRSGLQHMVQEENVGFYDAPTQPAFRIDDAATQQPGMAAPEVEPFRFGAITKSGTSRGGKQNTKEEIAKNAQQRRIICACGYDHPEGDMLQCHFCKTWQHLHCYGFVNITDSRRPKIHICYDCILYEPEAHLIPTLSDLAVKRRAVYILRNLPGYSTAADLACMLHLDDKRAGQISNYLRKKKFVLDAPESHSKGFGKSGKPRYVISKHEDATKAIHEELINPMSLIKHCYRPRANAVNEATPRAAPRRKPSGYLPPDATATEQATLETQPIEHNQMSAQAESRPLEHTWRPLTQVAPVLTSATLGATTPRTEYSEEHHNLSVHMANNQYMRHHTDTPSAQLPRTPCRKRPATGIEGYNGPARGTRSSTKRQKWSTSSLINVGEGYITPRQEHVTK
ncbi:hypothetical protein MBLNU457_6806t1 [Dothideomycetes sp. NU457]